MNVKQAIIDRLRATKRENIEKVIDYMENNGFFTYHCHRHHHYNGGLADHAWQTYQIALRLDAERYANEPNAQKLDEDSLAIGALLHDLCDCSGMRDIIGHGRRSAKLLKEIGFRLTQEEFLAVRFHMSLKDKTTHPLYNDALSSELRYIVHKADGLSAKLKNGYDEPQKERVDLQPYLCNITQLENRNVIYQVDMGWFLGIHSPYDGEIDLDWKDKIIGVKTYDNAELYGINDSVVGAIYILEAANKKGLFVLHHYFGMQGGAFFSPDEEPFIYDKVEVYCDWKEWDDDFGYVACQTGSTWKVVKVTQFPKPNYEIIGDGFSSAEEAMRSIGIDDCEKYRNNRLFDNTRYKISLPIK